MDLTFSRAAFSPVIAEANDRSDGIYSAVDGSLIAQGAQGLPVFVGVMQYSTRTLIEMIADGRCLPPRARRHLHRQRSLSRRHASDGCALRHAGLPRRQDLLLALQHRPLAGHRRLGARRLLGLGDRGRAGRPAAAAGETVQEGHARPGDLRDHHLQHPHRRPAHRRHQGAGRRAAWSGRTGSSRSSTATATKRSSRRSPNCAAAPPSRCAPISPRSPTASTARRPSSIPTASSTSR